MSPRLEQAMMALAKALDELEIAVERERTRRSETPVLEQEVARLTGERDRLLHELSELRRAADDLAELNARAIQRVDGAIEGVRNLLDRDER